MRFKLVSSVSTPKINTPLIDLWIISTRFFTSSNDSEKWTSGHPSTVGPFSLSLSVSRQTCLGILDSSWIERNDVVSVFSLEDYVSVLEPELGRPHHFDGYFDLRIASGFINFFLFEGRTINFSGGTLLTLHHSCLTRVFSVTGTWNLLRELTLSVRIIKGSGQPKVISPTT